MDKRKESEILAKRALQIQRGGARAAVLGVNDGLVSVLCIVLAVAGAGAETKTVLLSGFAGLLAGAVSMAAGEWISVQAQVELFGGVIKDVKMLVKNDRNILVEQIKETFMKSGHTEKTAHVAAEEIAQNDDHLTDEYIRHVMSFIPEELGSPLQAAVSSFTLFTAGALAPLLPWFFVHGVFAISLSMLFTAIGGLIVGAYISASSGESRVAGALRQLGIIVLAAVVTYGVGYLFGISSK